MGGSNDEAFDVSSALLSEGPVALLNPNPSHREEYSLTLGEPNGPNDTADLFAPGETRTKASGSSFKTMGFGPMLLKAIARKGYKNPTPIQRRTIPPIMDGRDVVGMARTGSGKTACFVLPMIEKLKIHSAKVGARAIVLAPSRELALQTLRVVKEMGKGTDLRTTVLVGGDSLEEQFSSIMANPDIIVATPGRFLHLIMEMNLDLRSVQYIVFDEADRLFEMGFEAQLSEILHKLPHSRQTLLFSATLPASLVEFTKAGLQDPLLIRLDVEQKVSEDLETAFFSIKPAEKQAGLLYILQEIIKVPTSAQQPTQEPPSSKKRKRTETVRKNGIKPHSTLIFVATKHKVEFITALLRKANYAVSYVYGSLDQTARRENVENFYSGDSSILVVTDVAARGIDIPILSNVINYDFPSEPKVFVHRVGRTARAGQRGWAYSLLTVDDAPYFVELVDFLGRRLVMNDEKDVNFAKDIALGGIPRAEVEKIAEWVGIAVGESSDLSALSNVAARGDKLYTKTRGTKNAEMVKRGKALVQEPGWSLVNPLLAVEKEDYDDARLKLLTSVSEFRPKETVFEIGHKGSKGKSLAAEIMRSRRSKITLKSDESAAKKNKKEDDADIEHAVAKTFRDPENYVDHFKPGNVAQEHGYDVNRPANSFAEASRSVMMNLIDDDGVSFGPNKPKQRWDSKKKLFVNIVNDEASKGKMIKGESGVKLPASMKSGRFESWQQAHKTGLPQIGASEKTSNPLNAVSGRRFKHSKQKAPKMPDKYRDDYEMQKKKAAKAAELKKDGAKLRTLEQIRKLRAVKERKKKKNARPSRKK